MLYAPRGTGKTTRMIALCEQLEKLGYKVLTYVALESSFFLNVYIL